MWILDQFLVGYWGDQISFIWLGWWFKFHSLFGQSISYSTLYGAPHGSPIIYFSSEPLYFLYFIILNLLFSPLASYNIILLLSLLITLYVAFRFFKSRFSNAISLFLSSCFVLTTYYFEHIRQHGDLAQIWLVCIFGFILLNIQQKIKLSKLFIYSLLIVGISLFSNYYGFFIIISLLGMVLYFLTLYLWKKNEIYLISLKNVLTLLTVAFICIVIALFPYFKANLLVKKNAVTNSNLVIQRAYSDFFIFSSRPWYFFIPSTRNPIFGSFSSAILNKLTSKHYFLFNNYFVSEDGGAFLGWIPILLFIISILYYKTFLENKDKKVFALFLFVIGVLLLISLPPYFTISGIKIYTTGSITSTFFKMFRTTVRSSIFILLFLLWISGFTCAYLEKKMSKPLFYILIFAFFIFNLSQTFVPINFLNVSKVPQVYSFVATQTPKNSVIAVYPGNLQNPALYWMQYYQRGLSNPKGGITNNLDSDIFTKSLNTENGLQIAKNIKVNYLVVSKDVSKSDLMFFKTSPELTFINDFNDSYLFLLK